MENWDEWKERLQVFLHAKDYKPLKLKELCFLMEIKGDDRDDFLELLNTMEREGAIVRTKQNRYMPLPKGILTGDFMGSRKGYGFVRVEGYDEDFFIPEHGVNGVFKLAVACRRKTADSVGYERQRDVQAR